MCAHVSYKCDGYILHMRERVAIAPLQMSVPNCSMILKKFLLRLTPSPPPRLSLTCKIHFCCVDCDITIPATTAT